MILSNFWDSYFSSYGEFGEFSLRFTAAVSAIAVSNKAAHYITAKIGDAGVPRQAAHYITAKIGDAGVPRHVK